MEKIYLHKQREKCIEHTGFSFDELLKISGVFGVHPDFDFDKDAKKSSISLQGGLAVIDLETNLLEIFNVRLHIPEKEIWNNEIRKVKGGRLGIGYDRLASQVALAKPLGIKAINLEAYGDPTQIDKYNGHITWGKYGFLMDPPDQSRFDALMAVNKMPYKNLYELLLSEDRKIWDAQGFSWFGGFDLSDGSESLTIFAQASKKELLKRAALNEKESL